MKSKVLVIVLSSVVFLIIVVVLGTSRFKPNHWKSEFVGIASSSSPQASDLNGDGVLDIVIGAGGVEFVYTDQAVVALDGESGRVLWKVGARNQVVGSPVFLDVTHDGIKDVLIGGRSAILMCIEATSGKLLWEFLPDNDSLDVVNDTTVLNFYNPQLVPDITNDGVREILVAYGGFIKAKPHETDRPSGYLMLIDPVTGREIVRAPMPDRKETYMSPVVHDFNRDGTLEVIFGSGGETIDGHLYRIPFEDLLKGDISGAIELATGGGKGFIAPVLLADVNEDGMEDIIVNAVTGRTLCIDGRSNRMLWEVNPGKGLEVYTTPGPGYFNNDNIPDFFTSYGIGTWPKITKSINVAIDGKQGKIIFQDTLGTFQYASPVLIDLSRDGLDDVMFAINSNARQDIPGGGHIPYVENKLVVFDVRNRTSYTLDSPRLGTNLGSTPLLTDLDNDGKVDIIYCHTTDASETYSFAGMVVERLEIDAPVESIRWSSYMGGGDFKSVFRDSRGSD